MAYCLARTKPLYEPTWTGLGLKWLLEKKLIHLQCLKHPLFTLHWFLSKHNWQHRRGYLVREKPTVGLKQMIFPHECWYTVNSTCAKNFSEILNELYIFSFKKMDLRMPSGNWRPFCLGLNILTSISPHLIPIAILFVTQPFMILNDWTTWLISRMVTVR